MKTVPALMPVLSIGLLAGAAGAYPTDEGERTGIRRLDWQKAIDAGERRGYRKTPPGAQWPGEKIRLKMLGNQRFELAEDQPKDPELQEALEGIMKKYRWRRYNIAILDITDPMKPRYAGINEHEQQTPGSVAKILLGAGMLQELAQLYPKDIKKREAMLKNVQVAADEWLMPNHHEVPVINGDRVSIRSVRRGDTFSLWEWMDNALSPSSNASATMMWREATLMHLLKHDYPPAKRDPALWKRWDKDTFTQAVFQVVDWPLVHAGIDPEEQFHIRLFFTRGANKYLRSESSRATPFGMVKWMLRVEQGRMVDRWSSLELKKMLYLTRKRIRYALAPELDESAVFFKSGSLYRCQPEEGYKCQAYKGNLVNVLNALVEVETPAVVPEAKEGEPAPEPGPPHVYIVAVMSNELKRSAAEDHARLGSAIHQIIVPAAEE